MHKKNDYERAIVDIFEDIPKAVLAAVAVSALTDGGERLSEATSAVVREWLTLQECGIVPQKPNARLLALI